MLAMHPIHLSNDKAVRSLSELEHFLTDLSTINLDELQHTLTPEPLRVSHQVHTNDFDDGLVPGYSLIGSQ
jgi:hypothetical protein